MTYFDISVDEGHHIDWSAASKVLKEEKLNHRNIEKAAYMLEEKRYFSI